MCTRGSSSASPTGFAPTLLAEPTKSLADNQPNARRTDDILDLLRAQHMPSLRSRVWYAGQFVSLNQYCVDQVNIREWVGAFELRDDLGVVWCWSEAGDF